MRRIAVLSTLLALGVSEVAAQGIRAAPRGGGHRGGGHSDSRGGFRGGGFHGGKPGIYSSPYYPRTFGSPHGYGNVLFPGTGHAPGTFSPFSIVDPTFGTRLTNTVSGFGYPYGYPYKGHYGYGKGAVVVPYPVYVPYAEPQPPVQVVTPPPQIIYVVPSEPDRNLTTSHSAAPSRESVVTYVAPSRQPEWETSQQQTEAGRKFYLIAFKNYSIYSATDYWLQGDVLHYLTPYGSHNQASLDQIDLEFTLRLNRERGLEFRLDKTQ